MAEERLTKPRSGRTCVRIAFSAGQITIPQSHDRRDRSWAIPDGHQHWGIGVLSGPLQPA